MSLDLVGFFLFCFSCRFVYHSFFFFSSRRRHTRSLCDWSSDVCSSDLWLGHTSRLAERPPELQGRTRDRKSTRLNSSHTVISYAVFCLKKKKTLNA